MKNLFLISALLCCLLTSVRADATTPTPTPTPAVPAIDFSSVGGKTDTWLGYERHTFTVDGCACWVAVPKNPRAGNHWLWCLMFPTPYPDRTGATALMAQGYYYAYISVGDTFGSPAALDHLDKFYEAMTKLGLRSKVALVGISRGGLYAYNWAARNPGKVSLIYGDAPVCNFESWPYGHGDPKSAVEWQKLMTTYGFKTNEEAFAAPSQPIHELAPIAAAHIPLLSVVGDVDTTVPYKENTAIVEEKYKALGGEIQVIHKPTGNHHPHGLDDPAPTVAFILQHDI